MWTLREEISSRNCDDRLRLGDLLGLQTLALQHVHEVHVAADVQLVGAVDRDPRSSNNWRAPGG